MYKEEAIVHVNSGRDEVGGATQKEIENGRRDCRMRNKQKRDKGNDEGK